MLLTDDRGTGPSSGIHRGNGAIAGGNGAIAAGNGAIAGYSPTYPQLAVINGVNPSSFFGTRLRSNFSAPPKPHPACAKADRHSINPASDARAAIVA